MAEDGLQLEMNEKVAEKMLYSIPTRDLMPHEYLTENCTNCGHPLPEFRKRKARTRCVECQESFERKR